MFRLGDFYEMFGDDAMTAAQSWRSCSPPATPDATGRMPMCGVPYHAVDRYVARLISRGLSRRDLRSDRGPEAREGARQARGHARRHARARSSKTACSTPGATTTSSRRRAGRTPSGWRSSTSPPASSPSPRSGRARAAIRSTRSAGSRPRRCSSPRSGDDLTARIREACSARFTTFSLDGFMPAAGDPARAFRHVVAAGLRLRGLDRRARSRRDGAGLPGEHQPAALQHVRVARDLLDHRLHGPRRRRAAQPGTDAVDVRRPQARACSRSSTRRVTPMGGAAAPQVARPAAARCRAHQPRLDAVEDLHGNRADARRTCGRLLERHRTTWSG